MSFTARGAYGSRYAKRIESVAESFHGRFRGRAALIAGQGMVAYEVNRAEVPLVSRARGFGMADIIVESVPLCIPPTDDAGVRSRICAAVPSPYAPETHALRALCSRAPEGNGECTLMAICTLVASSRVFSPAKWPMDDTVMRLGLQPMPHGSVRMAMAFITASRLSVGSAHAHKHNVGERVALRNRQYLVDDACSGEIAVETLTSGHAERAVHLASGLRRHTQSVARSLSGIYTASISRPPAPSKRYFTVPSALHAAVLGASRPIQNDSLRALAGSF